MNSVASRLLLSFISAGAVDAPVAPAKPAQPKIQPPTQTKPAPPPPEPLWNVILLDYDEHTVDYVIQMLGAIFGHSPDLALKMAKEVDGSGRVIVATVHKELAELRQEQIQEYGPDPDLPESSGSMNADIEPAV
jgi:ATP-dependent Clp protease adaptor protein ClpS